MSKFLNKIDEYNRLKLKLQQITTDIKTHKALKDDLGQEVSSCKITVEWVGRDFSGGVVYGETNIHNINQELQDIIRVSLIKTIQVLEQQGIEIETQIKQIEEE